MFNFFKKTKPINNAVTIVVKAEEQVKEEEKPPEVKYTKQTVYHLKYILTYSENKSYNTYSNSYITTNQEDYIKIIAHINESIKENYNILTINGGTFTCLNIGINHEDFVLFKTDTFISLRYINDETNTLVPIEETAECIPQI